MKAINICVTLVCILFFSTSLEAQKNGKQIREEVIAKSQHSIKQRPQEEQKNRFNPAKKEVRHLNNSPIKAPQLPQAVMRYTLDSMVNYVQGQQWSPDYKDEYRYDATGRYYQNNGWDRDTLTNTWVLSDRYTLMVNESGDLVSEISELRNENTDTMYVSWKELNTYDDNGNRTRFESYSSIWDEDKNIFVLIGNEKHEWAYDSQDNEIQTINYYWDEDTEEWIPQHMFEYRYDNDMELMFGGYMWDQVKKIWIGHFKFEHQWINEIEQMSSVYYHWNYETDKWYIQSKNEYSFTYETSGIVVTNIDYSWDGNANDLYPTTKTISSMPVKPPYGEWSNFRYNEQYNWNTITQEWDLARKTEITFNSNLMITEFFIYNRVKKEDSPEYEWRLATGMTNTLEGEKIVETLYKTYTFNSQLMTNELTRQAKTTNTFNAEGWLTEEVNQYWESTDSLWKMNIKTTYTYSTSGQMASETFYQNYSTETSSWTPARRTDYFYNPDESEAGRTGYEWSGDTSEWKMTYKEENYIDDKDREILNTRIYWNSQLNRYITEYQDQTDYDANDNVLMNLSIQTNMIWTMEGYIIEINGNKQEYSYNSANRLTQEIEYDYQDEEFIAVDKYVYTYDANYPSALIKEENYEFDQATTSWVPAFKGELTHNFTITKSMMILPFEEDDDVTNHYFSFMPVEYFTFEWDTILSNWASNSKSTLHYTQRQYTSASEISGTETAIYPNPAGKELFIRLDPGQSAILEIFNLQGRKVAIYNATDGQPVDISNLATGMYFYRIATEAGKKSGKLLKL